MCVYIYILKNKNYKYMKQLFYFLNVIFSFLIIPILVLLSKTWIK